MKKILLTSLAGFGLAASANAMSLTWDNQYMSAGFLYGLSSANQNIVQDYEYPDTETTTQIAKDDYNAFGINLGYGASIYKNVRAEIDFAYKYYLIDSKGKGVYAGADFDWKQSNFFQLTANAYYDFDTGSAFTPYVGVGLGMGYTNFKTVISDMVEIKYNDASFVYNLMLGISYDLSEKLMLDLKYRFVDNVDDITYELERTSIYEVDAELDMQPFHEFIFSVVYKF